ncbi:MAG: GspH/FimT family pseudopilin, partial [Xanthomonadales bacterium]|nr:GspH/FimT family pseudopilin [Xanthomonadales bacterium]
SGARRKGFTLIELMITVVIVAIGVVLAVPTYQNTVQKRRLTDAAESIAAFLALAQGEAIKRNETIAVSFERENDGKTWCLGAMIQTAGTDYCDCESTSTGDDDYCDFNPGGAGAPQIINQVGFESFTMNGSWEGGSPDNDFQLYFDPVRGVKVDSSGVVDGNTHRARLVSDNSKYSLQVEISVTGRILVCNPVSDKKVPGFKNCAALPAPPPALPI